jgi:hypothetical protein
MIDLPPHCRTEIRDWIRLGLLGILGGMILGIWWTGVRKKIQYGDIGTPAAVITADGKEHLQLPPGLHWEAGVKLKLSHGHVILITGVLPMCFAMAIFLVHACGGRPTDKGMMRAAFWLYAIGSVGAVGIMVYRGAASFYAIQPAIEAGELNFAAIQKTLFGGSKAIKGASYGISHSLLAVGCGILIHQLWRGVGKMKIDTPAPEASTGDAPAA